MDTNKSKELYKLIMEHIGKDEPTHDDIIKYTGILAVAHRSNDRVVSGKCRQRR